MSRFWKRLMGRNSNEEPSLLDCPHLNAAAIEKLEDRIAAKTVERLEAKLYLKIGQGVVHKLLWLTGLAVVSLAAWLHSKGFL